MANTSTNVSTGKPAVAGSVYRAVSGTTPPTDATTELGSAFVSMGYISADGLTNSSSFDTQAIQEWGGTTVYETEENKSDTFKMTFIEALNPDVLAAVHNTGNVSGTLSSGIRVEFNADEHENACWVIDMVLRGGVLKRICIPDAKISEVGEIVYRKSEAIGYAVTLKCFADSAGNYHYEYIVAGS